MAVGNSPLSAQEPKPKRHVFWRIVWCAGAGVLAALVPVFWWAARHENTAVFLTGMLVGTLALLPTVLLTLNLAAFPWDYSMFGSLRRATLPRDAEGLRLRGGIVIGRHFRQTWPGVGYLFHPQGLGMNIELVGVAFVPAENIARITRRRWLNQLLIEHNCRELRGPLLLFCPGLSTIEPDLPRWFRAKLRPDGGRDEAMQSRLKVADAKSMRSHGELVMADARDLYNSSSGGKRKDPGGPPQNSVGNLLSCSLLVILMIVIALVTAIGIVESGKPFLFAVTAGAINGVFLTCMAAMMVGSLIKWYWGRTRGYPFKHGDIVRVIRGEFSGSEGHIATFAQGEFSFQVVLRDGAAKGQKVWLSAHALRRDG